MSWKSVVAGVDDSPEGIRSAELALEIADRARVECYLVHAAREFWAASGGTDIPIDVGTMNKAVLQTARERLTEVLSPVVSEKALSDLEVRLGRAAVLVREVVAERDAGLVVLGAKHHPAVTRWVGGSTVHNVVRTSRVPVLVSRMERTEIRRVLVAVDISYATKPTISEASRFAGLFGAELRIVHVVEPLPLIAALPIALDQEAYYRLSEMQFNEEMAEQISDVPVEQVLLRGASDDAIADEVEDWSADVLVVGSHGKGWVDRLLVGSTTERLLNHLPTSTLVIPVAAPHGSPS
jgi:nucleotide-binding universal stress UspA family protein